MTTELCPDCGRAKAESWLPSARYAASGECCGQDRSSCADATTLALYDAECAAHERTKGELEDTKAELQNAYENYDGVVEQITLTNTECARLREGLAAAKRALKDQESFYEDCLTSCKRNGAAVVAQRDAARAELAATLDRLAAARAAAPQVEPTSPPSNDKPVECTAEQAWGGLPESIREKLDRRSFIAGYHHAGVEAAMARHGQNPVTEAPRDIVVGSVWRDKHGLLCTVSSVDNDYVRLDARDYSFFTEDFRRLFTWVSDPPRVESGTGEERRPCGVMVADDPRVRCQLESDHDGQHVLLPRVVPPGTELQPGARYRITAGQVLLGVVVTCAKNSPFHEPSILPWSHYDQGKSWFAGFAGIEGFVTGLELVEGEGKP